MYEFIDIFLVDKSAEIMPMCCKNVVMHQICVEKLVSSCVKHWKNERGKENNFPLIVVISVAVVFNQEVDKFNHHKGIYFII